MSMTFYMFFNAIKRSVFSAGFLCHI